MQWQELVTQWRASGLSQCAFALKHGVSQKQTKVDPRFGLQDLSRRTPNQLSGGQQQRVAIARALVGDPPLLLADEPTGNLDTRTSMDIMATFQELNQERGITILLVTHEPDIAAYSRRLVRLKDGCVLYDGPAAEGLHQLAISHELAQA